MSGIQSFHDSMALDRGILALLQSPEPSVTLPSSTLPPPGALRGGLDEEQAITPTSSDRMLEWATRGIESPQLLTPGGFQSALGAAIKRLDQQARAASDPALQDMLRQCTRLTQDQLQLMRLAEFNRNSLIQG